MRNLYSIILLALALILTSCQKSDTNGASKEVTIKQEQNMNPVANRPEKLTYSDFKVTIPDANKYRHQLNGNNVAYIMEDHALPLVNLQIASRAGWYILDKKHLGVAYLLDSMLREGGTKNFSPSELNEKLDFLATRINFNMSTTNGRAYLDTLKVNLDESLNLLFDMLINPGFDKAQLAIEKSKAIERIKRRNDDTRTIEPRVWDELMRGDHFFDNRMATAAQINSVTVADLKKYTTKIFANGQLVIGVSGDVDKNTIINKLNDQLAQLATGTPLPAIPSEITTIEPGLYGIEKAEVTQSRVSLGLPAIQRGNKDELAIMVMNNILGGGGFTSHIVSRVRSDEGLAYSAGSYFERPAFYQGFFRAFYQSKNKSVAFAMKIILEEINKIRNQKVTENELHIAKQSVNSALGNIFSNANSKVARFVNDDIQHINKDYWKNYETKVNAVTLDDIQRVAKTYLKPDQLRFLIVGNLTAVEKGDGEHGMLSEVVGMKLKQLRLRDPLTLKPLPIKE